jgi:nucleotide-binding universal stress UspA family protein
MDEFALSSADSGTGALTGEEPASHLASSAPATQDRWVIVGLDGREHDADALVLGRSLQTSLGGGLLLAHVIPPPPPGRGMIECERLERHKGQELLARASANLGDGTDTELVEPGPPAPGLSRLAAERHASMLVLGSSHRGTVGRIVPGGVASHLLGRAPCTIAVAPVKYAKRAQASVCRLGVAYDGTSEADLALAEAAGAATRLGVPLRLYHAMHEIPKGRAWDTYRRFMRDFAQGIPNAGLKQLPPELDATSTVLEGDVAEVIAEAANRDDVSLLYVGSRGYGPLREALVGGVAGALLQCARCPLVIVPRGAQPAVRGRSAMADAGIRT